MDLAACQSRHPARDDRFDTVKVILENPAYLGDYVGGRASNGKYHAIRQGAVARSNGHRCRKPESEWIVFHDHHPAIVDRKTFTKAQAILARGKTSRSPHTPETNPYLFTGLLAVRSVRRDAVGDGQPPAPSL